MDDFYTRLNSYLVTVTRASWFRSRDRSTRAQLHRTATESYLLPEPRSLAARARKYIFDGRT